MRDVKKKTTTTTQTPTTLWAEVRVKIHTDSKRSVCATQKPETLK